MFLYTVFTFPAAIVAGILLARIKSNEAVSFGTLDRIGNVTNIALIPIYACFLPFTMFLGVISHPLHDGFLGVLGGVVAVLIASAALFCGVGLGASVALRRRGKSVASFAVQFLGAVGIALSFVLYALCEGSLLQLLN